MFPPRLRRFPPQFSCKVVEEYITEIGRDAKFDTKKDEVHGRTGAELKWMNVVGKLDAQCRAPESVGSMV